MANLDDDLLPDPEETEQDDTVQPELMVTSPPVQPEDDVQLEQQLTAAPPVVADVDEFDSFAVQDVDEFDQFAVDKDVFDSFVEGAEEQQYTQIYGNVAGKDLEFTGRQPSIYGADAEAMATSWVDVVAPPDFGLTKEQREIAKEMLWPFDVESFEDPDSDTSYNIPIKYQHKFYDQAVEMAQGVAEDYQITLALSEDGAGPPPTREQEAIYADVSDMLSRGGWERDEYGGWNQDSKKLFEMAQSVQEAEVKASTSEVPSLSGISMLMLQTEIGATTGEMIASRVGGSMLDRYGPDSEWRDDAGFQMRLEDGAYTRDESGQVFRTDESGDIEYYNPDAPSLLEPDGSKGAAWNAYQVRWGVSSSTGWQGMLLTSGNVIPRLDRSHTQAQDQYRLALSRYEAWMRNIRGDETGNIPTLDPDGNEIPAFQISLGSINPEDTKYALKLKSEMYHWQQLSDGLVSAKKGVLRFSQMPEARNGIMALEHHGRGVEEIMNDLAESVLSLTYGTPERRKTAGLQSALEMELAEARQKELGFSGQFTEEDGTGWGGLLSNGQRNLVELYGLIPMVATFGYDTGAAFIDPDRSGFGRIGTGISHLAEGSWYMAKDLWNNPGRFLYQHPVDAVSLAAVGPAVGRAVATRVALRIQARVAANRAAVSAIDDVLSSGRPFSEATEFMKKLGPEEIALSEELAGIVDDASANVKRTQLLDDVAKLETNLDNWKGHIEKLSVITRNMDPFEITLRGAGGIGKWALGPVWRRMFSLRDDLLDIQIQGKAPDGTLFETTIGDVVRSKDQRLHAELRDIVRTGKEIPEELLDEIDEIMRDIPGHDGGDLWISTPDGFMDRLEPSPPEGPGSVLGEPAFGGAEGLDKAVLRRMSKKARASQARRAQRIRNVLRITDPEKIRRELKGLRLSPDEAKYLNEVVDNVDVLRTLADPTNAAISRVTKTQKAKLADSEMNVKISSGALKQAYKDLFLEHSPNIDRTMPARVFEEEVMGGYDEIVNSAMDELESTDVQLDHAKAVNRKIAERLKEQLPDWKLEVDDSGRIVEQAASPHRAVIGKFNKAARDLEYFVKQQDRAIANLREVEQRLATEMPTAVSADAARNAIRALERKEEAVAILQQRVTDFESGNIGNLDELSKVLDDLKSEGTITPKQHKEMSSTLKESSDEVLGESQRLRLRDDLDNLVTELDNEGAMLAAKAELLSPALDKEHPRFKNTVNKLTGERRKLMKERLNAINKGRKIRPGQYVSGDEAILSELLDRLEANTLRGIVNRVGPVDFGAGQIRIGPKGKRWVAHDSLEARPLLDGEKLFKSPSGVLYREARPDEIGSRIRRTEKDTVHEISEVASDYVAAGFRTKDPAYRPRNVRERIRDNPEKGEGIMDYILENKYGGGAESPWDLGRYGEAIEPKLMPDGSPRTLQKWFEDTFPEENKRFYRDMGDIQGAWDNYADSAPSALPLGAFDGVSGAEFRMMIMATDDVVLLESLWDAFTHHNREYRLEKGKAGTLPVEAVRQQIDSLYGRRQVVSFACPTCVAKPGGACVRPGGQRLSRYHSARAKKADVLDPNQTAAAELRAERIMDVLLPDDPMAVSGRFELKRDYVIREGDMVRVVGDVDQPRLNAEASRQVRDKVGAHLIEMSENGWPSGYLSPSERRYYRDLIEKHAEGVADATIARRVLDVDEKLADNHRRMTIAQKNRRARLLHREDPAGIVNLELEKMNQAIENAWLAKPERDELLRMARELSNLRHEASAASRGSRLEAVQMSPEVRQRRIAEIDDIIEEQLRRRIPDRVKIEQLKSEAKLARDAKDLEGFKKVKRELDAEKAKAPDWKLIRKLEKEKVRLRGERMTRKQKKVLTQADELAMEISEGLRAAGMKVDDLHQRIDGLYGELENSLNAAEHRFREFHVNSATPNQSSLARKIMEEAKRTGGKGPSRSQMAAIISAGELPRAIPGKHIAAGRAWQLMQKLDNSKAAIDIRKQLEIEHNLRPEQMTDAVEQYLNLLNDKFDAAHLSEADGVYINRPHNAIEDFDITQLSESSRIASDMRTKVMNLGAKAVKEGLLSEITFGMHIAEYFPDLYKQYEALFQAFSDRGGISVLEELMRYKQIKGNHFRHAEYKSHEYGWRKDMGLISDPRYTSVAGFSRIAHDVELARLFRDLDEAVFAPEHALHPDKKLVRDPVYKPDKKGRKDAILSNERPQGVPNNWKQLPGDAKAKTKFGSGTRGFGRIGGKWVPEELFDELVELQKTPGDVWNLWRNIVRFWKVGMTVLNPASHMRNFVTNITIADFNGMLGDPFVREMWGETWREAWELEGRWVDEAFESGLLGTDQISIEVNRELGRYVGTPDAPSFSKNGFELAVHSTDAMVRHSGWSKVKRGVGAVAEGVYEMSGAKRASEFAQRAYVFEDNFFKLLRFKQIRKLQLEFAETGSLTKQMIRAAGDDMNAALALMDNADPHAAVRAASQETFKHFFDYSNVSRAVNWARNHYQPFMVWNSKAIPMMGDMMTRYPVKGALYRTAFREMENLTYHMEGEQSEEDIMNVEEKKSQLSAYSRLGSVYKGRRTWTTPEGKEHTSWQFGDLQYWTPAGNLARPSDEFTLGFVPDIFKPNDPILSFIQALVFNRRPGDWGNDMGDLVEWDAGAEFWKDALPAYWDAFRHTMAPPLLGGRGYDKLEAAGFPLPPIGANQTLSMDPHPYYANVEGKPMDALEAFKDVFFGFRTAKMYQDGKAAKRAAGQIQGAKSTGSVRDLMLDKDRFIAKRKRRTLNAINDMNLARARTKRNQAWRLDMMKKTEWRDLAQKHRDGKRDREGGWFK